MHSIVEVDLFPSIELELGSPLATAAVVPSLNHLAMVVVFSQLVVAAAAAALESMYSVSAECEADDPMVTVVTVVTEVAHHHRS